MSDDVLIPDDGEEEDDNASFRQLRQHAKKLEKELASLRKEAEELRRFREEVERQRTVEAARAAFREAGLPDALAELYVKAEEGEATKETVLAFAKRYGLAREEPAGSEETEEQQPSAGFAPTVTPQAAPTGRTPMTWKEFADLHRVDPARAVREAQERGLAEPSGEVGRL